MVHCLLLYYSRSWSSVIQKSMSLKSEPSSEPLHISVHYQLAAGPTHHRSTHNPVRISMYATSTPRIRQQALSPPRPCTQRSALTPERCGVQAGTLPTEPRPTQLPCPKLLHPDLYPPGSPFMIVHASVHTHEHPANTFQGYLAHKKQPFPRTLQ